MPHQTVLLATIAAGLGLAFLLGMLAHRLRLPPLVGYLVAGVVLGPYTPRVVARAGMVADVGIAAQLAEIGVILLMFGVGMHFSLRDLLAVRRIALPGALAQIVVATALGASLARLWGWSWGAALVFGLSLSVASTVVLLRALEARGVLDTVNGRIALGWLIVEDVAMVLVLVLLPAVAGPLGGTPAGVAGTVAGGNVWLALGLTVAKVAAFVALMLAVGARAVPWLLERVARTGSRELFTLGVLALGLGVAIGAASLFGVSLALGAFFAGIVISESELSHQAAADALPFQDAFAVLFFVSVGMLFDPTVLVERPIAVLATVAVIMLGQSLAAFTSILLFGYPLHTALTVSAGLAQIGEFSFILAGLGVTLGLLPPEGQSLILAGALVSITLNPFVLAGVAPVEAWLRGRPGLLLALERAPRELLEPPPVLREATLHDHAIIVGFGRVGGTIARALERPGLRWVAVEQDRETALALRDRGLPVIYGDAARPVTLEQAHVEDARLLVIATPDAYQSRRIIELARRANPRIEVVARTHSEAEQRYLERQGVGMAVMGERELALGMARYALRALDVDPDEADVVVRALRTRAAEAPPEADDPGTPGGPAAG